MGEEKVSEQGNSKKRHANIMYNPEMLQFYNIHP